MNARMKTPSTNGDGEFVTHARCKERHGSTRWTLIFLGGFFLLMLGGVGTAMNMSATTAERVSKVEARQDSLDKVVVAKLDEIWRCVQDEK
jgi:hypothetical protein